MDSTSIRTATAQTTSRSESRRVSAEEWRHLYMVTGFSLVLEGILVQMILGDRPPANLLVWLILGALTICLALYNPGTRDALLRSKERFESDAG